MSTTVGDRATLIAERDRLHGELATVAQELRAPLPARPTFAEAEARDLGRKQATHLRKNLDAVEAELGAIARQEQEDREMRRRARAEIEQRLRSARSRLGTQKVYEESALATLQWATRTRASTEAEIEQCAQALASFDAVNAKAADHPADDPADDPADKGE